MKKIIGVIGIGYVGLQNAIAISKAGFMVIGFDKDKNRVTELQQGIDKNQEAVNFSNSNLIFTDDLATLTEANHFLISVPTPINERRIPNVFPLKSASRMLADIIKKDDVVVLESTVFPGATRELLIPILEEQSGLKSGLDFFVGYSSERIVPGDTHSKNTTKVISGQNAEALKRIKALYEDISSLKLHCAPSIEVAESSKLLENIQRDVNIALMNEFAQIMETMNLSIHDVLDAAKTKWNFLPFTAGLVGGHCIPEDPYYLIYQANKSGGVHSLISCARQTNEQFYHFITEVLVKLLTQQGIALRDAKIGILGMSFKANVTDMRHSLSIVLYQALKALGMHPVACDSRVKRIANGIEWQDLDQLENCQALIICQAHNEFLEAGSEVLRSKLVPNGVFIDIPGIFSKLNDFREEVKYWSL